MKTNKGKGNRKAQKMRRKARRQVFDVKRQSKDYELIDGNFSHYPVGYCKYHKGWLTIGLEETHKCRLRECKHYEDRI